MKNNYKLKLRDFVPYKGAIEYSIRSGEILDSILKDKSPISVRIKARALELYSHTILTISALSLVKGIESIVN